MSITRIPPEYFDYFTIETHPHKTYTASGLNESDYDHVTGAVALYNRASTIEKETGQNSTFLTTAVKEGGSDDLDNKYRDAHKQGLAGNNFDICNSLLTSVNAREQSVRKQQELKIYRSTTGIVFDKNFNRKRIVREVLYPHYRSSYPSLHWAYTNYHSLNFVTGALATGLESLPQDTALMYPNKRFGQAVINNEYMPRAGVSFDFRINPRYKNDAPGAPWQPGTIYHLPGAYAVSLHSGSSVGPDGKIDRYRLSLQILSGTVQLPSSLITSSDGVYFSDDNILKYNHWHHVVIRWGGTEINNGTGSFIVDGANVGNFVIPSASLHTDISTNPEVLFIGNFYSGEIDLAAQFFAADPALREGLVELTSDIGIENPVTPYSLASPLNAEVHELRIWNKYLNDSILQQYANESVVKDISDLLFYLPPFFTPESPFRSDVNGIGGVMQTPFAAINSTTDDPFNVALSFGLGAHYINLENYTRDFARANYPRAYALTASQLNVNSEFPSANQYLYASGSVRKRNITILPCDDGLFVPNYELLSTGSMADIPVSGTKNFKYTNDLGSYDASLVSLTDLISTSSYIKPLTQDSGTLFSDIAGASPEDFGIDPGQVLTIYQRTGDNSSNAVTLFDVSNMFYGNRINPTTLKLIDPAITGSAGKVSITLRDNGRGSIYRADALTPHATWANVGDVLYDEGLIMIKNPHLMYYGRDAHTLTFNGVQNIHTLKIRARAAAGLINSSSNPTYHPISASLDANDFDRNFVYITGIHLHDENMNVVVKTTLAQPIIKRTGDKIDFKIGIDF